MSKNDQVERVELVARFAVQAARRHIYISKNYERIISGWDLPSLRHMVEELEQENIDNDKAKNSHRA